MTGPDLKPCPFCGGAAEYRVTHDEGQMNDYDTIECLSCRAEMSVLLHWAESEGANRNTLTTAWNTRDPAVLAALPEVQALIAANYRKLVAEITGNPSGTKCDACRACGYYHCADAFYGCPGMRDYTLEEATAALAKIEREAEARGRVKGMREAAGVAEGAWGEGPTGHYDNGGTMDGWNLACSHVASAILARAAKIEADALTEVYYQREMASDEPQGPNDLSISGSTPSVAVCGICDIADCHHIRARKESGA